MNDDVTEARLLRIGRSLEWGTLLWNVVGVVVLFVAAVKAVSVALAGFGIDSLVEIGASTVVLWELHDVAGAHRARALRLIGVAFYALATYLTIQAVVVVVGHVHPKHSTLGIVWTALTVVVMVALARGKTQVGRSLNNQVLISEGGVTRIDAALAAAVLLVLVLNAVAGWWWADPAAGVVVIVYAIREGVAAWGHGGVK